MMARAPVPATDFDDSCPTLEIPAFAPSSGVWRSQGGAPVDPVQTFKTQALTLTQDRDRDRDPAMSTLHDVVNPHALAAWQNERLLAADPSLASPAERPPARARMSARMSTTPMPGAFVPPNASNAPVLAPNGTLSPDGTLLPWRHERPPSRRGAVALAMLLALVASAGATVGFVRSASQPVAIMVRVARTPAPGIRHLQLVDSTETKREAPGAAAAGGRLARRAHAVSPVTRAAPASAEADASARDALGEGLSD